MTLRTQCVMVISAVLWACVANAQVSPPPPKVLARIGTFNVTDKYLNNVVENRFAREVMEEIIRTRVIEDAAQAKGIRVSQDAVNAQIEKEKAAFASDEEFLYHVQQMGLTPKGYREKLRIQLLLDALLAQETPVVTDEEARAYWEAHKAEFSAVPELHILDIVTASEQEAVLAFRALADGTPFEVVVRRYGVERLPGRGGDLGFVTAETIPVKALWEAAAALKEGQVGGPLEVDGQYHVFKLQGWRAGGDFEAVKDDIKARLQPSRGISEEEFLDRLLAAADVKVLWAPVYYLNEEYALMKGIRVYVDDRLLRLRPQPFVGADGVMLVPARPVLEALEAELVPRPVTGGLEARRGNTTIIITPDRKQLSVNDEERELRSAPVLRDGVLFIPPRDVLGVFGVKVSYHPATKVLRISTAAVEP